MKKTILLLAGLVLILSLCGNGEAYAEVDAKKVEKAITKTEKKITKWESAGYTAPKAKEILEKARRACQSGDYEKAYELTQKSHNFLEQAQEGEKYIQAVQAYITKWEAAGYAIPRATEILGQARQAYQSGDYEKALELAQKSHNFLMQALGPEKYIKVVQAHITRWESVGRATPRAKELLEKARRANEAGRPKEARELAGKSLASLKVEVREGPKPTVGFYLSPKVNLTKYRKIAVLGFNDAPNAPGSGKIITDIIASELSTRGYNIIHGTEAEMLLRKYRPTETAAERASISISRKGKILGVDAVITGNLSQWGTTTTYTVYYSRPVVTAVVELTIEMIDTKTGSLIWQGHGSHGVPRSVAIQPVARAVIKTILDKIPKKRTQ